MHIIPDKLNQSINEKVKLGGFVHTVRDHGSLIFIDLRSELNLLQCVISSEKDDKLFAVAQTIKPECVLELFGKIQLRSQETVNNSLSTGMIELSVENLTIVSQPKTLPFDVQATDSLANEEIRLKYRYLDLRREKLKKLLIKKHKLVLALRNWFDTEGFVEVQTPILANSSPEGARDYLIPSRLHPGMFYALPQAPQQFKQLLMVGGFNKYFQIAPCFRDEDPRSDRHPGDFYQIDAEIAWADEEQAFEICEKMVREVVANFTSKSISSKKFRRLSYLEAMNKYGSDKPDMRYDLAWQDAKQVFTNSSFKAFADLCSDNDSRVQALVLKNKVDKLSRSDLDRIQSIGRQNGLPGIAYIQYYEQEVKSPIFKFFESAAESKKVEIQKYFEAQPGDVILFIANKDKKVVWKAQDQIRQFLAKHFDLIDHGNLEFVWVNDFPFYEKDEKTGELDFTHNPFGAWQGGQDSLKSALKNNSLSDLKAIQYDLTLNGFEILSGGVRNQDPEALLAAFAAVGYSESEVRAKFGHMLQAYEYGSPKHAGFAWGLDRLFMILEDEYNIREVIAFPKNGSGMDTMVNSPSEVSQRQLKELHINKKA
ncbi:MAG: aspartate--tRNA ligase [Patescibacteria group bacterium]